MNDTTNTPQQAVPGPGETRLKAERVQGAPPAFDDGQRLKAERIQLALRDLPGWRLARNARVISRTVEVASLEEAARLLLSVAELAFAGWSLPLLQVSAGRVTFTLPTVSGSWLEEHHFELAKALNALK
jgi:pterin-4a-carbinolamine dehydratase